MCCHLIHIVSLCFKDGDDKASQDVKDVPKELEFKPGKVSSYIETGEYSSGGRNIPGEQGLHREYVVHRKCGLHSEYGLHGECALHSESGLHRALGDYGEHGST